MNPRRPTILSVDDDADIRDLVRLTLEAAGYQLHMASNAEEALERARAAKPDLVIMDVMMPGRNGYEAAQAMQEAGVIDDVPVIFMTALSSEADRDRAFAVGAVDFLSKPINRAALLASVEKHLTTNRAWKELEATPAPHGWSVLPSDFVAFRDSLIAEVQAGRLGEPQQASRLTEMRPQDLYSIGEMLGMTTEEVARRAASQLGLDYVPLVDAASVKLGLLPVAFCKRNVVLPVMDTDASCIKYIVANPFNLELMGLLQGRTPDSCGFAVASPESIRSVVRLGAEDSDSDAGPQMEADFGGEAEDFDLSPDDIDSRPVVFIANSLIMSAIRERASDVHVEPKEAHTAIRFRVDGDMRDVLTLKKLTGNMLISRLKAIAGLDIAERRRPQDGSLEVEIGGRRLKLRLATSSGPYGESLVVRLLDVSADSAELTDLGLSPKQASDLSQYMERPQGLILVVGPTGSGKTTTIYSLLSQVDSERRSLMSVEDPVEYTIARANQQQVNEKAGVTFESLLKSSVRQDPDILFLGEIRDEFSARTALDFASTGHLTVSTLHTSNATSAVFRLERLGVDRAMMADAIGAIVAQRLVKTVCPSCRRIEPITDEERRMLEPFTDNVPETVAHPVGCPMCHKGYSGRIGVQEVLGFDEEVAGWVRDGLSIPEIRALSAKRGDYLMSNSVIDKVRSHLIAPADAYERILAEEEATMTRSSSKEEDVPVSALEPVALADALASSVASMEEEMTIGQAELPGPVNSDVMIGKKEPISRRVLIIDDDEDTLQLLSRVLAGQGYVVTMARSGTEGLSLIRASFDLVLSDINMPGLDGLSLLERAKRQGITSPIVMLSGSADMRVEADALRLGAADFLSKPIRRDVLLLRLGRVLESIPESVGGVA